MAEFRRVLNPGGRVVACVARALEHNPFMRTQAEAPTRHIGPEVAGSFRAVCALSEGDEIRGLFEGAGFEDIDLESVTLTLRHPDGRAFMAGAMAATPAAAAISRLPDDGRTALLQDVLAGFGEYFDGQALAFPHAAHVVVAR